MHCKFVMNLHSMLDAIIAASEASSILFCMRIKSRCVVVCRLGMYEDFDVIGSMRCEFTALARVVLIR